MSRWAQKVTLFRWKDWKKKTNKQINSNKNHLNQKTGEKEKPDFKKNTPKKPLHVKLLSLIFLSIFTFILHSFPFSFSYMRGENTEAWMSPLSSENVWHKKQLHKLLFSLEGNKTIFSISTQLTGTFKKYFAGRDYNHRCAEPNSITLPSSLI